jgi:hypothetical protein
VNIDWSVKEGLRGKLRVMVKRIGIFVTAMTGLLLVVRVSSRRPGPYLREVKRIK